MFVATVCGIDVPDSARALPDFDLDNVLSFVVLSAAVPEYALGGLLCKEILVKAGPAAMDPAEGKGNDCCDPTFIDDRYGSFVAGT